MWSAAFAHFTADDSIVPSNNPGFMNTICNVFIEFKLTSEDELSDTIKWSTDSRNISLAVKTKQVSQIYTL